MADAIPAAGSDVQAPDEAAQVTTPAKKQKAPAKVLEDGFVIPEGAVELTGHEAYRMDF